jgi:hypothetical protein
MHSVVSFSSIDSEIEYLNIFCHALEYVRRTRRSRMLQNMRICSFGCAPSLFETSGNRRLPMRHYNLKVMQNIHAFHS